MHPAHPTTRAATGQNMSTQAPQPGSKETNNTFNVTMFQEASGSEEMSKRFNDADSALKNMEAPAKNELFSGLIDNYGLADLVVSDTAKHQYAVCVLASVNCQNGESLQKLVTKLSIPTDQEASTHLKEQANKDNSTLIPTPTDDNPSATKPMSLIRQNLVESFVHSTLSDKLSDPSQTKTITSTIAQAKFQIASGSDMGAWPLPAKAYNGLTQDTLLEVTACRIHPESVEKQDELKRSFAAIQAQFSNPESDLVTLLTQDQDLTRLLNDQQKKELPQTLTELSENKTTLNNKACLLYCQVARSSDFKEAIKNLDIDPHHVDLLAKGNLNMNHLDSSKLSQLTNIALNDALSKSDAYPRTFFTSELYSSHKDENGKPTDPIPNLVTLWIMSQNPTA